MIDLDNNATTRPTPSVVEAVKEALTRWWQNPSSIHRGGQAARQQVELARKDVAALIGSRPREIVFTSSGTEAIHLAVRGLLSRGSGSVRRPMQESPKEKPLDIPEDRFLPPIIVSTKIEHAAVRDLLEDLEKRGEARVRWAPITPEGILDLDGFAPLLEGALLASVQWANNETGAIQPIEQIGTLCRERGVIFHCDATQWVGKMPVEVDRTPVDLLTFSAHKFHGPKGAGMLWMRRGVHLAPMMQGSQELGRRGGTENVPGVLGAGAAAREATEWLKHDEERERCAMLRDRFERRVLAGIPDAVVNGPGGLNVGGVQAGGAGTGGLPGQGRRLWNTTNIGFPRVEAEALLLMLSERGVCASAGAACSSGSLDPSPVLLAMGVPAEVAHGSLRFSLSRETTEAEIDEAADILIEAVRRLRGGLGVVG